MRISDWSSDVCSSDLTARAFAAEARSTAESALSAAKATLAALDSEATALRKAIDNGASHHRALDRIKAAPGYEHALAAALGAEIGSTSCRGRVCQYV